MRLANKLKTVEDSEPLHKVKGNERLVKAISKLKNLMTRLGVLAEEHGILRRPYTIQVIWPEFTY